MLECELYMYMYMNMSVHKLQCNVFRGKHTYINRAQYDMLCIYSQWFIAVSRE